MSAIRANALGGADWLKNSFSIWRDLRKDRGGAHHPAPFPVSLATRLIDCFAAHRDGIVLDPFAGAGSALLAALRCGMGSVGVDVNPEYRRVFEKRLSALEHGWDAQWTYHVQDSRSLGDVVDSGSIELCITSPPYWDVLNRRRTADRKHVQPYSANRDDLGNLSDYEEFLDALAIVSDQVGKALRAKGYFVMNVMDVRKGPCFYALHQDATTAVVGTGRFTLEDIIIWDRQADYNSMRPLGYPYKFIVNKVHEYLLVFRKEVDVPGKLAVSDSDLYEIATYLSMPEVHVEIHAEVPFKGRHAFEEEYAAATGDYPLPEVSQRPYYVWPTDANKYGRELRIYFDRVAPEPPPIKTLYTDHGKWFAQQGRWRINHSKLVMQLLKCGFILGKDQDRARIDKFMARRFPVADEKDLG